MLVSTRHIDLFFYLIVIIDITVQPVSINTTLNSTVVFYCEATADDLSFRVNNLPGTNTGVMTKGFSASSTGTGDTIRAELQGTAYTDFSYRYYWNHFVCLSFFLMSKVSPATNPMMIKPLVKVPLQTLPL